ncbi:hypothetical protein P8452_46094 [Trifolium repens]|nr:hypothetical protein QL285_073963 [Trifolium repens]WJX60941.1 hypothetical protein P8452_46094 [Trifolium repens]
MIEMDIHKHIAKHNAFKARARRKHILQQRRLHKRFPPPQVLKNTATPTSISTISSPLPPTLHTPQSQPLQNPYTTSSSQTSKPPNTSTRLPLKNITSSITNQSLPHIQTPVPGTQPSLHQDFRKKSKKLFNITSLGGNLETRFENAIDVNNSTSKHLTPFSQGIALSTSQPNVVKDIPPKSKRFYNIGSLGGYLPTTFAHHNSHVLSSSKSSTSSVTHSPSSSNDKISTQPPPTRSTVFDANATSHVHSTSKHQSLSPSQRIDTTATKPTVVADIPPQSKSSKTSYTYTTSTTQIPISTQPQSTRPSVCNSDKPSTSRIPKRASTSQFPISPQPSSTLNGITIDTLSRSRIPKRASSSQIPFSTQPPSTRPTVCNPEKPSTSINPKLASTSRIPISPQPPSTRPIICNPDKLSTSMNANSASNSPIPISPQPPSTHPTVFNPDTPSTSRVRKRSNNKRKVPVENLDFNVDSDNSISSLSDFEDDYMDYSSPSSSDDEEQPSTNNEPVPIEGYNH